MQTIVRVNADYKIRQNLRAHRHTDTRLTAAHKANRLMLLGSPPDMVHSALPHRIRHPHVDMHECILS